MRRFLLLVVLSLVASVGAAQTSSIACGGSSQPRCEVNMAADSSMTSTDTAYRDNRKAWDDYIKSMSSYSFDFKWTFIPQIPTAFCVNPKLEGPLGGGPVEMDICGPINIFGNFINGVLAFFCLLGCVKQIRDALAA